MAAVLLFTAAILIFLQTRKPVYSGEIKLKNLSAPVTVFHDEYGIPHIYGSNEEDVYRALGYLITQERWFQMEMIRRVSSGRLSELLGASMIDVDRFFRTLGFQQLADRSARDFLSHPDQPCQKAALAYLDGINQYIETGKEPVEFRLIGISKEKFSVSDLYLVFEYLSFNFQMGFRTDPLLSRMKSRLGDRYIDELALGYVPGSQKNPVSGIDSSILSKLSSFNDIILDIPVPGWLGSNAFAVSPRRTASGKVLIENDTHIGHQQPSVWFEAHLEYPGFRFYGNYLAGFPFAPIGHTMHHTWGLTMLENDDLDFYEEEVSAEDSNLVRSGNSWHAMNIRKETIHVKDSQDVNIICRESFHGPVCSDVMNDFREFTSKPVSACWTFLKFPCNLFEIAYELTHTKGMGEFRDAVSHIAAPGLNIIYGDSDGNIAWYAAAAFVKRPEGIENSLLLDGSSGTNDWLGYYDFSFNPKSENPPEGYVYSCNHQPDSVNGILHPGYYLSDDRARRLSELLESDDRISVEDARRITTDHLNPNAARIAQILCSMLDRSRMTQDENASQLLDIVDKWDGSHSQYDQAPMIYYAWLYQTLRGAIVDETGESDFQAFLKTHTQKNSVETLLSNPGSVWWDDTTTSKKETEADIVTGAFNEMTRKLSPGFDKDTTVWNWGKMHRLELKHPVGQTAPLDLIFNIGPNETTGGMETINNMSFTLTDVFPVNVNLGPALRRILDFSDPENAISINPSGQSGHFMSEHYDDQSKLYTQQLFRKELMNEKEIRKNCKEVIVFRE